MRTRLAIERLSDAIHERRMLWVLCKACGHTVRLDPRNLVALKGDAALRDIQRCCLCRRCGKRRAAIVVNDREGWPARS